MKFFPQASLNIGWIPASAGMTNLSIPDAGSRAVPAHRFSETTGSNFELIPVSFQDEMNHPSGVGFRTTFWSAVALTPFRCECGRRPPDGDFVGQLLLCLAARSAPPTFWSVIENSSTESQFDKPSLLAPVNRTKTRSDRLVGLPHRDRQGPRWPYRIRIPQRFLSCRSRCPAACSVSSRLQKQKRTC